MKVNPPQAPCNLNPFWLSCLDIWFTWSESLASQFLIMNVSKEGYSRNTELDI